MEFNFGSASELHVPQMCLHQPGTAEVESDRPSIGKELALSAGASCQVMLTLVG